MTQNLHSQKSYFELKGPIELFITALLMLVFLTHFSFAQTETPFEWTKNYGDGSFSTFLEVEDGYVVGGNSYTTTFPKTSPARGSSDYWVVKLDRNGNKMWDKTFGGSGSEDLKQIIRTSDNQLLLMGASSSDVSGNKTTASRGGSDYWIVKITLNGDIIWDRTFGGVYSEYCRGGVKINGGLLIAGTSNSPLGGDKTEQSEAGDYWVVKVDNRGNKVFDKIYDSGSDDYLNNVIKTTDGGYILGGSNYTGWFVRANSNGDMIWEQNSYFSESDAMGDMIQGPNGVNMVTGSATFYWGDEPTSYGGVVELNEGGYLNLLWSSVNTNFTLSGDENAYFVYTESYDGNNNWTRYSWDNGFVWSQNIVASFIKSNKKGEDFVFNGSTISKLQNDANPTSRFFYKGVDLNSKDPNTLIASSPYFTGDAHYLQGGLTIPNFTYTGKLFENQSLAVSGSVDVQTAKMLRSLVYGSKSAPATFNFNKVEPGVYEVFLYNWEDNNSSTFSIDIQGQRALSNYKSGPAGNWAKLGPFRTTVTADGTIKIATADGDANISGIEIWKVVDGVLENALNFNSTYGYTLDGEEFKGSKVANNFSFVGKVYENQSIPLTPATDNSTAKMLRSCIYSTKAAPSTITVGTETNGMYEVYLYLWEDNFNSNFTLNINNQINYTGNTGNKGEWKLLGPFKVTAVNNKIVIKASGGDANLSGIKIYRSVSSPTSSSSALRLADKETEIQANSASFNAFPNPFVNKVNIMLPKEYKGKTTISLVDNVGQTLTSTVNEINDEKVITLDLPEIKPGLYYVKVKNGKNSEIRRVYKK